jgi:hypothetical protein
VDEHQAILAQVGDNGATRVPATLPSVSVFETGFVVWELKLDAPYAHGGVGSFTLSEPCKIAQVALRMEASDVTGEFRSSVDFQHIAEIAKGGTALVLDVLDATIKVVVTFLLTTSGTEDGKVPDCVPKTGAWRSAGSVL